MTSDATILMDHGTTLYRLKPVNIVQAAEADLKLAQRKGERRAADEEPYSFDRRHARRATSAAHLVALAYFSRQPATNKRSTLLIYRDRPLLRAALIDLLKQEMS